jgi:Leucine-rich repeat (LRR) protein
MPVINRILHAKKTGILNMSQLDYSNFPPEILNVEGLQFGDSRWWEFLPITKFDISFNSIECIPENIFESNLLDLTYLNMSNNKIKRVPACLGNLIQLKSLNLSSNLLERLDCSLPDSLIELKLSRNKLSHLPLNLPPYLQSLHADENAIDLFESMIPGSLRILEFSSNMISSIAESVFECEFPELKVLNLSKNKLKYLPKSIRNLRSLVDLDISANHLVSFPSDLVAPIERLILSFNQISSIDSLPNQVKTLLLNDNRVEEFPECMIEGLPNLVTLDLKNNNIKRIPPEFSRSGRPSLVRFYLEGNPIKDIPQNVVRLGAREILGHLSNRLEVDLSEAGLKERCDVESTELIRDDEGLLNLNDFGVFRMLKRLSANKNCIVDIPRYFTTGEMKHIQEVQLKQNKIVCVPIIRLPSLQILNLSGNRIEKFDMMCLSHNILLKELNLSLNKIRTLTVSLECIFRFLACIDLEDNQLREISENIQTTAPSLETLKLANNNLEELPNSFGFYDRLKCITMHGNPQRRVPQRVLVKGTDYVKQYLRDRSRAI